MSFCVRYTSLHGTCKKMASNNQQAPSNLNTPSSSSNTTPELPDPMNEFLGFASGELDDIQSMIRDLRSQLNNLINYDENNNYMYN